MPRLLRQPAASLLLCFALGATGCNVERVAQVTAKLSAATLGKGDTAIGGVNLLRRGPEGSANWDRHITACTLDAQGDLMLRGDGQTPVLRLAARTASPSALVYGPRGPELFQKEDCTTFQVTTSAAAPQGLTGDETLICSRENDTLNTTVHFKNCTQ